LNASESDPHTLRPDHAPTPFSASEIRGGCPDGRIVRFLIEGAGAEPFIRVTRFVEGDEEGAEHESQQYSLDGQALGQPVRGRSTWIEFQSHASFPLESTVIVDDDIEVPAGRFACLRYTVTDGTAVDTFWFARERPGMPVKVMSVKLALDSRGDDMAVMTMLDDGIAGGIT
jgi:hypothetical protein